MTTEKQISLRSSPISEIRSIGRAMKDRRLRPLAAYMADLLESEVLSRDEVSRLWGSFESQIDANDSGAEMRKTFLAVVGEIFTDRAYAIVTNKPPFKEEAPDPEEERLPNSNGLFRDEITISTEDD